MNLYLKTKDHSVSKEKFQLILDTELDMLVTDPQPKNISVYYESEDYISHTDASKTIVDKIYQAVKKISFKKKLNLISSFGNSEKTLLDIGAGTGDFVLEAKRKGWVVNGVEPNKKARSIANDKGVAFLSSLDLIEDKKFQVITLWHVLEHLPDLENQIKKILSFLEPDGTLIIAVPNFKSFDAKHYKGFWAAYDVPRHLWHFSKTSIKLLFQKNDMKVVSIKPMVFDSFYVSLLSEKYKTGKQNYFKAFIVGLCSNIKAWKSKEYSSHIYVLKKV